MNNIEKLHSIVRAGRECELLKLLRSDKYGIPRSEVEEITENFADRKPEEGMNYYYYSGPLDEKTRPFCSLMLTIDKVFSEEEIAKISEELNYSVLKYKGSYKCRHDWIKFRGKRIYTPAPTQRDIRKLINKGIQS